MLFPERIRIVAGGQLHFFESAADASSWLDAMKMLFARPGGERQQMIDTTSHRRRK